MTKSQDARNLTSNVAARRQDDLNANFPTLDRSQYPSEAEYRQALIDQYQQMRQAEYQYVCHTEGIKAYDVSISICQRTGNSSYMNRATWNGCQNVMQRYPDMSEAISDSCYVRIPDHVTNTLNGGNYNCCSVSSKALESQISAEMGYDGNQNFVKFYNDSRGNSSYHRAANGFVNDPACQGYVASGSLWNMIESGKVGPGATVAIPSRNTGSGYHAKTVIAVNYDNNGKVKSYVLQGNNSNSLEVVTQKTKYSNVRAADMNRWMANKLQNEAQNINSMSTEALEAAVSRERSTVSRRINEQQAAEEHLFATHGNVSQVNDYADWYLRNSNLPVATRPIMKADKSNAVSMSEQQTTTTRQATQRQNNNQNNNTPSRTNNNKAVNVGPSTPSNDAAGETRMRSLIDQLNKRNGASKQLNADEVIESFTQQFGSQADKVLVKALMSPAQFIKDMNLDAKSSREVIQHICNMNQDDERLQVALNIATARRQQGR